MLPSRTCPQNTLLMECLVPHTWGMAALLAGTSHQPVTMIVLITMDI